MKTKQCRSCEQPFEAVTSQAYCRSPCIGPSYQQTETRRCIGCGTDFEVGVTSQRFYCTPECRAEAKEARRQEDRDCKRCGAGFRTSDRRQRYCSMECAGKVNGPRNSPPHHLKHPDHEYADTDAWSRQVRKLAGNACADCGATETLHAHHIVPRARGGRNTMRNGVCLCKGCHEARHFPVDGDLVERIASRVVELLREAA